MGTKERFIACRICDRLNAAFYPATGFAAAGAIFCRFKKPTRALTLDAVYVRFERLSGRVIPDGDLEIAPDLAVEVLSPQDPATEVHEKLDRYLEAGMGMVWIVNPNRRTIRVYRSNGTARLYRADDTIENEPLLSGFVLRTGDIFPEAEPMA